MASARSGAVDLARAKMTDEEVYEALAMLEMANGLRCNGCGRRITTGLQFTSFAPREQAPAIRLAACSRADCRYAERCREGGTYMEMVEYVWLDEYGYDAPPSKSFTAAREREAAKENGARTSVEDRAAQSPE